MKLATKLILAFLFVSLIAVGLAAAFIWSANSFEFSRYLQDQRQGNFADAARNYYQQTNDWRGIERAMQQQGLLPPHPQGQGNQPPPPFALVDQNNIVIIPSGNLTLGQQVPGSEVAQGTAIQVNGQVVGTVLNTGQPLIRSTVDQRYVDAINRALWIAALGGILSALLLGTLLARTLTRPVIELTGATRAMARGELSQQVPVRSSDELGDLAASFNQMSADLARANQSRRQMTADIAHDLRNPLTVIGGYLESLKDGKLKPTPERFETMHSEVQHLQRLVEDLRTLSLADAGDLLLQRAPTPPAELLQHVAAAYQHQAAQQNIRLTVDTQENLPDLDLDQERMEQVLGNLVSNALRYTPGGGQIRLAARQTADSVLLSVADTGSGIPPEVLPHIFERSFRGDESRSGSESGLGLAIARSIMELHGGRISVSSQPGQGAEFTLTFPSAG